MKLPQADNVLTTRMRSFFLSFSTLSLLIGSCVLSTISANESSDPLSKANWFRLQDTDVDEIRKELDQYFAEIPKEYEDVLTKITDLLSGRQYAEADKLLQSARKQYPDEPDLLARHAETIALMNSGNFIGEPFGLLSRALDADRHHKPSLWMMALVNQQSGNHEAAVILLRMLKNEMTLDGDATETVSAAMALSMLELEKQIGSSADQIDVSIVKSDISVESENIDPSISLYITLEQEIFETFNPDDTVFVYARATNGPAMPLAVTRRRVSDFPALVTLDNSMAMMPSKNLSSSNWVTVGARASRSGTAMALTGDWEVELYEVPVSTTDIISIHIAYQLK